jgi:hypothetical protein
MFGSLEAECIIPANLWHKQHKIPKTPAQIAAEEKKLKEEKEKAEREKEEREREKAQAEESQESKKKPRKPKEPKVPKKPKKDTVEDDERDGDGDGEGYDDDGDGDEGDDGNTSCWNDLFDCRFHINVYFQVAAEVVEGDKGKCHPSSSCNMSHRHQSPPTLSSAPWWESLSQLST